MTARITRRSLMAAGTSALAFGTTHTAFAQTKPKMRFSCAFPETDLRAEGYKAFAAAINRGSVAILAVLDSPVGSSPTPSAAATTSAASAGVTAAPAGSRSSLTCPG